MTTTRAWWIAAAVLGLAAGYAAIRSRPGPRAFVPESDARIVWKDPDAPRRIRAYAAPIEAAAGWPGLGDFLVAVAYIESRGNSQAGRDTGNLARGWGGMRPKSSSADKLGLDPAVALKTEPDSVALSADYAHRMGKHAAPGQVPDWLAIRRGWASFALVDEVDNPGFWRQLAMGYKAAGVPASQMLQPAFPAGYHWPGVAAVLEAARGVSA